MRPGAPAGASGARRPRGAAFQKTVGPPHWGPRKASLRKTAGAAPESPSTPTGSPDAPLLSASARPEPSRAAASTRPTQPTKARPGTPTPTPAAQPPKPRAAADEAKRSRRASRRHAPVPARRRSGGGLEGRCAGLWGSTEVFRSGRYQGPQPRRAHGLSEPGAPRAPYPRGGPRAPRRNPPKARAGTPMPAAQPPKPRAGAQMVSGRAGRGAGTGRSRRCPRSASTGQSFRQWRAVAG